MPTRPRPLSPIIAVALAGVIGCSDNGDAAAVDATSDLGDTTSAPVDTRDTARGDDTVDCHYDCFGGVTCAQGVFIVANRTAIPCGPHLDEAWSSPYGACFHHGEKTPCASGLCTSGLCSDDHQLHEDLVGPDATPTPCLVQTSAVAGAEPTLIVGPEDEPLLEVADLHADAFAPNDDLTLTLVANLDPEDLTLSGAAASTQPVASATLYGAAALRPYYPYPDPLICRGALVATLSDGAEVRVVWATSIDCMHDRQPHQATCRVLHVPAGEAR